MSNNTSTLPILIFTAVIILASCFPVYAAPPEGFDFTVPAGESYVEGELLVRFSPKPSGMQRTLTEKNQILGSLGGGVIRRNFKIVPGLTLVELPVGLTVEDALITFNNTTGILYAQPNYIYKALSTFPNDTLFDDLWAMHNTGQSGGTPDADIDAPEAWDIATDSNIIVAVIDTGVDYTHPDIAANMWVNEAELNGTPGVDDDDPCNGYVDDIYGYDFCTLSYCRRSSSREKAVFGFSPQALDQATNSVISTRLLAVSQL